MKNNSMLKLLKKIHEDENGSISLETILIIGAIALPILIFLLVKAWPTIKTYFNHGAEGLEERRHHRRDSERLALPLMLPTVVLLGMTLVAAATDVLRKRSITGTRKRHPGGLGPEAAAAMAGGRRRGGSKAPVLARLADVVREFGRSALCGGLMIVCFFVFPRHRRGRREADGHDRGDVRMGKGIGGPLVDLRFGSVFSVIILVWQVGPVTTISRVVRLVATRLRLPWFMPLSDEERGLKAAIFWRPVPWRPWSL